MAQRTECLLVTLRESDWVQLTATPTDRSLGYLSAELMVKQTVLMMVHRLVRLRERSLDPPTATPKVIC